MLTITRRTRRQRKDVPREVGTSGEDAARELSVDAAPIKQPAPLKGQATM
jgi:hypothetical protein